ncbi:SMP-30/gluconolactonase/LRE family protein [Candidatus Pelagibacter bacterium]|nr:SMP-30/gluconolactonase/LRE family protein [Candidatus Pelagibacter bacterium]MDA7441973.1 SMP-30/gluconolactonase/LRE family protein [Candidatus Pelagibacter ubique]MDA8833400.1 SMP-30/gluconolactonase/LRE family protein [Candidatus Pelagibacter bacterium]
MNIITSEPKVIWNSKAILGEGTLWVPSHNSIYFVDIKRKRILILNIKTNKKRIIKIDKEIGFLTHIKKDIFILGLQSELRIINLKNKETIRSIPIEEDIPLNRINDGKIDPKGRLWFGTMDNLERNIKNGSLYCLDKKLNIHKVDTKYYITNGPAFIDSENFLHTDSRSKTIYKIKIDKKYKIIKKTKFLKFFKKDGSPDGMTIDSKKNVWVCHYGGACISVYNLKGKKIHKIDLPAKNITNCTFGGLKNNELFVTTALKGLKKSEIENYKYSGSLFNIKTNIKGLYTKQFNI